VIVAVVIVLSLVVVGLVITQVDSSQQVSSSSNSLGLSTQVIGVTESLISPSDGNFVVKLLNNSGEFITISNVSVGDRNVAFSEDLAQGSSKLFKVVADSNCTLGKVVSSDVVITYVTVDGLSKVVRYPSKVMFDCSPFVITQANLANQCPSSSCSYDGNAVVGDVCNSATFYSTSGTKLTGSRTDCSAGATPVYEGYPLTWSADLGSMTWDAAKATCAALTPASRLPTVGELMAGFNGGGFQQMTYYWSSSEYDSTNAWIATSEIELFTWPADKTLPLTVRCVH